MDEEEDFELRDHLRELSNCIVFLLREQLKLAAAVRANNRMLLLKGIATREEMRDAMAEAQQLMDDNIAEAIRRAERIHDLLTHPGGTGKPN